MLSEERVFEKQRLRSFLISLFTAYRSAKRLLWSVPFFIRAETPGRNIPAENEIKADGDYSCRPKIA